jgi:repressor LexA
MGSVSTVRELTERQREVLEYVLQFQTDIGRPPTGPEISTRFGFRDHSSAYQHLKALQKKGYIELMPQGRGRQIGLRLGPSAGEYQPPSWAVLGSIPAGPLTDVVVDGDHKVSNLPDLIPDLRPGDYILIVNGDSMIDEGLYPGNYVVVRPTMQPEQGDICAVWVDGEGGTLKRVLQTPEGVKLVPANRKYRTMEYPVEQVRIQGVVVASFAVQSFRRGGFRRAV